MVLRLNPCHVTLGAGLEKFAPAEWAVQLEQLLGRRGLTCRPSMGCGIRRPEETGVELELEHGAVGVSL